MSKFSIFTLTDSSAISHKKHKKHKKKHKKKKDQGEDYAVVPEGGGVSGGMSGVGGPKIKLKLKIGGQTMGTKKYVFSHPDPLSLLKGNYLLHNVIRCRYK